MRPPTALWLCGDSGGSTVLPLVTGISSHLQGNRGQRPCPIGGDRVSSSSSSVCTSSLWTEQAEPHDKGQTQSQGSASSGVQLTVNKPRVSRAQRSASPGLKPRTLARLRRKGPCVSGDSSHSALRSPTPQRTRGGPQGPRNSSNAPGNEGLQGSWPGWTLGTSPLGWRPCGGAVGGGAASRGACAHRGRGLCTRFLWAVCAPNRERET